MTALRPAAQILAALVVAVTSLITPAMAGERVYFSFAGDPRLPECTSGSVQSAVAGTLARANVSYAGGRRITSIDRIRQVAYQDNGVSPIARRYCRGTATLTDGTTRAVHYKLVEHAGFVGVSWNVEACIAPLDKWYVYGAHCSTVRPR